MMESTNTNATEMEDASPRSDASRPSTPGKSPKPTKSPKQANRQTRNVMPLFGKEAAETAKLLRELRVVSDAGLNSDNYGGVAKIAVQKLSDLVISDTMSCASCGITFDTREEQTEHYKSDWHRFNLKQRLRGGKSVAEATFMDMADNISSLSGTDFTDSEGDNSTDKDTTTRLLSGSKSKDFGPQSDDEEDVGAVMAASRQTRLYLKAPDGQILSMYRAILFNKKENAEDLTHLLQEVERLPQNKLWIVLMMGGGHFAAAVFDDGEPVVHKTFHRYVVRAKAGGVQSQHDKKGGPAKSAGAQIRRHNEAMLTQEIGELLQSWSGYIDRCNRIFMRVATHHYPILFGKKEKSLLNKGDVRIRMVPFPTRRATFSEVKRIYNELSSLRIHDPAKMTGLLERKKKNLTSKRGPSLERKKRQGDPREELAAEGYDTGNEADVELSMHEDIVDTTELREHGQHIPSRAEIMEVRSAERKRKNKSKPQDTQPEEKKLLPMQSEFYTACTLGDVEQLQTLISSHKEEITDAGDFSSSINLPVNRQGHTLLHIACQNSHPQLVTFLLSIGCDPSIEDEKSIVPYLSTQNKAVRNAIRIYMGENPDRYDYNKAQIPGPLTKEMAAEKDAKDSERKKEINRKKKEKLKAKKAEQAVTRAEEEEKRRFLNLSDREKRALAAEKRLLDKSNATSVQTSQPVLSRCYACATDITGKVPFEYSNNVFCSPSCLKTHRNAQKSKS